jgi:hypothetical protein
MHRRSLLLSRPLSVCVKLKDLVGKIEPRQIKHAAQNVAHQAYAPLKDHPARHQPNHALSLQEDYDSRTPAEPATHCDLILEHRYPHMRALRTDAEIGDGLWLCCSCQHPNRLIHFTGAFPFKHLTCARCDAILCPGCLTSEVLSLLPWGMVRALPAPGDKEVRYLHVCTTCGLSHRAEIVGETLDFYGVTCRGCRTSSYGEWARWYVGSVEPYRRDPDLSYMRLVEMRAERAMILARRPELGCRNPDRWFGVPGGRPGESVPDQLSARVIIPSDVEEVSSAVT